MHGYMTLAWHHRLCTPLGSCLFASARGTAPGPATSAAGSSSLCSRRRVLGGARGGSSRCSSTSLGDFLLHRFHLLSLLVCSRRSAINFVLGFVLEAEKISQLCASLGCQCGSLPLSRPLSQQGAHRKRTASRTACLHLGR